MKRILSAVLCLILFISVIPMSAAAEGDPVMVTSVTLAPPPDADNTLVVGETMTPLVEVLPADAANPTLTWTSGNDACAVVDGNGMITAIAAGTATITAAANDISGIAGTMDITVVDAPVVPPPADPPQNSFVPVTGFTISAENGASSVLAGHTLQFTASATPQDATDASFVWNVINGTGTATIDPDGLLTPGTPGSVTVTAISNSDIVASYALEILSAAPAATIPATAVAITAANNAVTVAMDDTLQFTAAVTPPDATDPSVVWSVTSGTGTAAIDSNGLLTPGTPGSVTVTATAVGGEHVTGNYSLEILPTVPVIAIPVTAIAITAADNATSVAPGGTLQLSAAVTPIDATDPSLVWSVTNDTGAANVDANGLVTGGSVGNVTITATANDGSGIFASFPLAVSPFAGAGTAEAPYLVETAEHLAAVALLVNGGNAAFAGAHYRQTGAIRLSASSWTPIGTGASPFTGTFDGRGLGIADLSGGGDGNGYYGLFAVTHGATLTNIVIDKAAIALAGAYAGAGAIVGHMSGGTLSGSYVAGSIETTFPGGATGGLVGVLTGGAVTDCMNAARICATQNAGGIAGQAENQATIGACYGVGSVQAQDGSFGRVVGRPADGVAVQNCFAVDGTDPLAKCIPWADGDKAETYTGFDFSTVWEMGTSPYYALPVLKSCPFAGDESFLRDDTEYGLGYIPPDISVPNASSRRRMRNALPSAYQTDNLPAVRNQGSYGTCWAHSVLTAAEISRIRAGESAASINYAELQLAWFHYKGAKKDDGTYNDPLNNFGGDHNELYAYYTPWSVGGNDREAGITLSSWIGAIQEDGRTSYGSANIDAINSGGLPYAYAFSKDAAHLNTMRMIPWSGGNDAIKQAIMDYGAVTISYCHNEYYFFTDGNRYFYMDTPSYEAKDAYENTRFYSNHAVTIVGWDDGILANNFRDRFADTQPATNGAWIVRNSYGSGFGNSGYFYMSYETKEHSWDGDFVSFWVFTDNNDYARSYQYDGTSSGGSIANFNEMSVANAFTATQDESVDAISFWLEECANVNYTIRIYTGLTDIADPTSGTLAATETGTTGYAGYYMVELTTPVSVASGDRFSVAITFSKPGSDVIVPMDFDVPGSYHSCVEAGQSYSRANSYYGWVDLSTSSYVGNCRIKAFTTNPKPVTGITVDSDANSVDIEGTLQMRATVAPSDATNPAVAWSVTNGTGSATIDANGLLTGVTAGAVTVKATAQDGSGVTGTKAITVLPKKVTSIEIIAPTYVEVGSSVTCLVTVLPQTAENKAVTWRITSGASSATIGAATGELTGVAEGSVTITATAQDGSNVNGETTVTIVAANALHTVTVDTASLGFTPADELFVDGVQYRGGDLSIEGKRYSTEVLTTTASNAVIYSYNSTTEKDPHKVYPTKMSVWTLTYTSNGDYTATRITAFDDLLQYAGSSIRITGVKGIRLISGVPIATRNQLINSEINGYHLEEYGTVLAWAGSINVENPLTLRSGVMSGFAYKRGVKDPIFRQTSSVIQYTNVLTNLTLDKCTDDLLMRPYIKLKNAAGQEITLYGGIISRSIGYIAYQNRNAFAPKSAAYEYIWEIIHHVYGDTYDADYQG